MRFGVKYLNFFNERPLSIIQLNCQLAFLLLILNIGKKYQLLSAACTTFVGMYVRTVWFYVWCFLHSFCCWYFTNVLVLSEARSRNGQEAFSSIDFSYDKTSWSVPFHWICIKWIGLYIGYNRPFLIHLWYRVIVKTADAILLLYCTYACHRVKTDILLSWKVKKPTNAGRNLPKQESNKKKPHFCDS